MHLSILAAFQGLGMTVGPAIQSMLTPLKCSPSDEDAFPYFSFDMFSSAGLVNVPQCIYFFIFCFLFFNYFILWNIYFVFYSLCFTHNCFYISVVSWVSAITGIVALVIMLPGIFYEYDVAQKEYQYIAQKKKGNATRINSN